MDNPLLDFTGLPRYAEFRPEHITPACDVVAAEARAALAAVTAPATPVTWDTVVEPLTDATERFERLAGVLQQVNGLVDTPAWREEFNKNVSRFPEFMTELGQNLELLARYKTLASSPDFNQWPRARKAVVTNALREFRLSGADLDEPGRRRFAEIQKRLTELSAKFEQNVSDATDAFQLVLGDRSRLVGIPEDTVSRYAEAARAAGKDGWLISLQAPSYQPVLQYAEDRRLRAELYEAYGKRASEFGPAETDNTPLIREWLVLMDEQARLLGFAHYAELSVVRKMAETPAEAVAFLRDLAARAKPHAAKDRRELEAFARTELGLDTLEPWDLAFASEKLREARYSYTTEEVKQYFPEARVLEGLFRLLETLYDVRFQPAEASVWHPSARYYRVFQGGREIAGLYLDLHSRQAKHPGAWMDNVKGRRRRQGALQLPVAQVICNFPSPVAGKPALVPHDNVTTLFHEFGHALQHMLTRVDEIGVSGINGVEWDAVELPSQFMENFCWEWDIVQSLSAHVDTGEPLPRALFDKMLAAKNYQSGMATVRQLEFGLFDLLIYSQFDPAQGDWLALLDQVRQEVAVNPTPAWHRFPNIFGHIFAGGYAAGYYSYKWAEVLSADAYAAFEEEGGPNPKTGGRFLDEILAVGGSRPSAESFRAFRGRDPRLDALLRHSGMDTPAGVPS